VRACVRACVRARDVLHGVCKAHKRWTKQHTLWLRQMTSVLDSQSVVMLLHINTISNNARNKWRQPSGTCSHVSTVNCKHTCQVSCTSQCRQNNALPILGLPSPRLLGKECLTIGNDVTRTEASFRQVTRASDSGERRLCAFCNCSASLCCAHRSAATWRLLILPSASELRNFFSLSDEKCHSIQRRTLQKGGGKNRC